MSSKFTYARRIATRIAVLLSAAATEATAVQAEHVSVDLISESSVLVPGKTAWFGLHLRHDPHWHSYWINPGDSGLPTRLKWTLPDGYTADAIAWPAPSRFEVSGLYNFGYAGKVVLPVAIHVPESATPGQLVTLSVEASWLVCREECVTGKANLELGLPVAVDKQADLASQRELFLAARKASPQTTHWTGTAVLKGDQVEIRLDGAALPERDGLDVFSVERRILANAPADIRRDGDSLIIMAVKNDYFDKAPDMLDLVLTSGMTNGRSAAWQVRVPFVSESVAH